MRKQPVATLPRRHPAGSNEELIALSREYKRAMRDYGVTLRFAQAHARVGQPIDWTQVTAAGGHLSLTRERLRQLVIAFAKTAPLDQQLESEEHVAWMIQEFAKSAREAQQMMDALLALTPPTKGAAQ
jgi:hypothetical protein